MLVVPVISPSETAVVFPGEFHGSSDTDTTVESDGAVIEDRIAVRPN